MNGITLNALGLLGTLVLSVSVVVCTWTRPTPRRSMIALVLTATMLFLGAIFTSTLDADGQPLTQWVIPGICAGVLVCGSGRPPAIATAIAVTLFGILLTVQANKLLASGVVTADPHVDTKRQDNVSETVAVVRTTLAKRTELLDDTYPVGLLPDPLMEVLRSEFGPRWLRDELTLSHSRTLWHLWLTGLWATDWHQCSLTYPGGKVRDALGGIDAK